jgi:hypothetical protein
MFNSSPRRRRNNIFTISEHIQMQVFNYHDIWIHAYYANKSFTFCFILSISLLAQLV